MGDAVKAKVAYDIALNCLCESGLNQSKQVEWKKNINEGVTKLAKIGKVKPKKDPDQPKLPLLLSGPSNEFPSASSAMYVDADQNVGRHFKAKQDIKPGENVATEKAYAACLLTEKLGTHCLHCFVRWGPLVRCVIVVSYRHWSVFVQPRGRTYQRHIENNWRIT